MNQLEIAKLMIKIKLKIREKREEKGLSLNQLAKISEISKSHLSDIERGVKIPSILILVKISKALEIEDERELYGVILED